MAVIAACMMAGSAAAQTPPPAAPRPQAGTSVVLAGDDQHRVADCNGQGVTVTGNRSAYVLRGGCTSVTLRGDLLMVRADLAPAARIAITGRGSILTWSIKPNARPPATSVHGAGSRAQRLEPS